MSRTGSGQVDAKYRTLRATLAAWLTAHELASVDHAYEFAARVHVGERRTSGEPYIRHPVAVAEILSQLRPGVSTIIAALLHDTIEEKPYDAAQLAKLFGAEVANLVEGVTKLDRVKLKENPWLALPVLNRHAKERLGYERHVESLRKMLLAMTDDIRVILIKLADRIDNMRTLAVLRPDKRERIARDTLEVFAPIANRLGMGEWKGELQDLAFPYVYPKAYDELKRRIDRQLHRYRISVQRAKEMLSTELTEAAIPGEIHGRVKHLYSLWTKLERHENDLDRVYDIIALRVIVDTEAQCYQVLGLIHKLWKPLLGRIKDYIALPKPNGYQSLHTTVFGPGGTILEVQIRTREMHVRAEQGVAAHWLYATAKDRETGAVALQRKATLDPSELRWLREMRKWQEGLRDIDELKPLLKTDFFSDRIFCFTPAGDVIDLPAGSTPIDFAYQIHTSIGNHCAGATADGRNVALWSPLQNGQIVAIRASKQQHPRRDWLAAVKTEKARTAIRGYLEGRRRGLI